jgi:hypothetical protein
MTHGDLRRAQARTASPAAIALLGSRKYCFIPVTLVFCASWGGEPKTDCEREGELIMRRVILTVLGVGALVALPVSSATAGGQRDHVAHGAVPGCGPVHIRTPHAYPCTPPKIKVRVSPSCQKPGNTYTIPLIHIKANGGVRKIIIRVDGKVVKTLTYHRKGQVGSLRGPRFVTLRNFKIHSRKFEHAGRFKLTVTVIDWKGHKATAGDPIILICKPPPPPFTG